MVPKDGPDRSGKPLELRGIVVSDDRSQTPVDNVPANQNQIRILGVDQVYPPSQFSLAVVVAKMKVAGENHR